MLLGRVSTVKPPEVQHGSAMVTIIVGSNKEEFTIHKWVSLATVMLIPSCNWTAVVGSFASRSFLTGFGRNLICGASDFFDKCFNGDFVEGVDQVVNLPETDAQLFQIVYTWLYSGRVADSANTCSRDGESCFADVFWWKLYLMADRLLMPRVKVLAVHQIQHLFGDKKPLVPSNDFLADLFQYARLPLLETYLVSYVVFWVER
jgi:hypothetical protein